MSTPPRVSECGVASVVCLGFLCNTNNVVLGDIQKSRAMGERKRIRALFCLARYVRRRELATVFVFYSYCVVYDLRAGHELPRRRNSAGVYLFVLHAVVWQPALPFVFFGFICASYDLFPR